LELMLMKANDRYFGHQLVHALKLEKIVIFLEVQELEVY